MKHSVSILLILSSLLVGPAFATPIVSTGPVTQITSGANKDQLVGNLTIGSGSTLTLAGGANLTVSGNTALSGLGDGVRKNVGTTAGTLAAGDDSRIVNALAASTAASTYVAKTVTVNGHALSGNVTVTKSDVSLGSVENTALSTWAGTGNITTVGTLSSGTVPFSLLSSKPTTLSGYGITDAGARYVTDSGSGANTLTNAAAGNSISSSVAGSTISGGGFSGTPNLITGSLATIAGGYDHSISTLASTVSGGGHNHIDSTDSSATHGTISGGSLNIIRGGDYASIGGGTANTVSGSSTEARIGGGANNTISTSGLAATISGGVQNTATQPWATIGGGTLNTASQSRAVVGGGDGNTASGNASTIAGGFQQAAAGDYSAIPGGYQNETVAAYSVALGRSAKATRAGGVTLAAGYNAVKGDAAATWTYRHTTTTDASTANTVDVLAASTFTLTGDGIAYVTCFIAGGDSTGTVAGAFKVEFCMKRVSGTYSQVGSTTVTSIATTGGTLAATASVNSSLGGLIKVTGVAATTVRWGVNVLSTEVLF